MYYKDIERSIITTFRKEIWSKFVKAVQDYKLINENDKIMCCISGGKDSFLLAKLLEELKKHGKFKFDIVYVTMNPGYNKTNLKKIKENAKKLNIDLEIFESDVFKVSIKLSEEKPCYMCARMRRGCLYKHAKDLGCNKIALAHHFDDVIETNLLSMFYSSEIRTMMPKLHSQNFEGLELIRPMYYIREENIIKWAKYNKLSFINCACPLAKKENNSKRKYIKKIIKELSKDNPNLEYNIFKSMENVELEAIISYKDKNGKHNFLDYYDKQ